MDLKTYTRQAGNRTEYALGIIRTVTPEAPFESELPEAKGAISKWYREHGDAGRRLMFSYVAVTAAHSDLVRRTAQFINSIVGDLPFVAALDVLVVLVDADRSSAEVSTVKLKWSSSAAAGAEPALHPTA